MINIYEETAPFNHLKERVALMRTYNYHTQTERCQI